MIRPQRPPMALAVSELLPIPLPARSDSLAISWPSMAGPVTFIHFETPEAWRTFVERLRLNDLIPVVARAKCTRAQRLYLLGWIDADLVKAGELVALIALELAVRNRYGGQTSPKKPSFAARLQQMVEVGGLTDADIQIIARYRGTALDRVQGTAKSRLADMRYRMAHGNPFDAPSVGGLLELVRDPITFAYRHYLAEAGPTSERRAP
jgi:hypothetical protein